MITIYLYDVVCLCCTVKMNIFVLYWGGKRFMKSLQINITPENDGKSCVQFFEIGSYEVWAECNCNLLSWFFKY